jgi:PAS domain S-box-containing protein
MSEPHVVRFVGTDETLVATLRGREDLSVTAGGPADVDSEALSGVDCLVTEQALEAGTGLELAQRVRERRPTLPIVLVDGTGEDEVASAAVAADIDRYVPTSTLAEPADLGDVVADAMADVDAGAVRYRTLVEETMDVVTVVDPDGTIEYVDPSMEEALGIPPDQLLGTDAMEYVVPADRDQVREAFEASFDDPTDPVSIEFRVTAPDGSTIWLETRVRNFVGDPAIEGVVVCGREITERKERERELARYEAIVEAVDDMVYTLDEEGRFTFANTAHETVMGYDAEDLIGGYATDTVRDEDVQRVQDVIRELYTTDRSAAIVEAEVQTADGEFLPCEFQIAPLTDDEDGYNGTAGIVRDVSDRKQQEDLYRTLVREAHDGIVITKRGDIKYVNEQMAALLETEPSAVEGEPVLDMVAPDDRELVIEDHRERLEGPSETSIYEVDLLTADGDRVPVEVSTSLVNYEGGTGELGIVRDLSGRRERERELELYERMLNTVPDMVYALDETGRFTAVNRTMLDVSGWSERELLGQHVSVGMADEDVDTGRERIIELLTDDEQEKAIYEMMLQTKDGETIPVENHIALLTDDDEFRGSVGVLRDISDRRRRERRLTVLNRALRHDLRNSMHVILANAEVLERDVSEPEPQAKLATIQRRAEDISSLSEKAREIERTLGEGTGNRTRVDLARLLDDQLSWFGEQYPDVTIEETIPDHAWVHATDLIDVAVENLVENSIEHTRDPTVEVTVAVAEETVTVTVADDGPGIPEKERQVLDQGVETPLDHASGLGLWLVAWITQDSGGELVFDDSTDGSTVRLVLDRVKPPGGHETADQGAETGERAD